MLTNILANGISAFRNALTCRIFFGSHFRICCCANFLLVVVVTTLFLATAASGASPVKFAWQANSIVNTYDDSVLLRDTNNRPVTTVSLRQIRLLIKTLNRIENAANTKAELWIAQLSDNKPNAIAFQDQGKNFVIVSLDMLDLLGYDVDAYAFLLGHELAHIAQEHGSRAKTREQMLQALGILSSAIVGAKTGIDTAKMSDLSALLIDRKFSRGEEKEADELALHYMIAAGYDASGALRLNKSMKSYTKTSPLPFLNTHPTTDERIADIERKIALSKDKGMQNSIKITAPTKVVLARTNTLFSSNNGIRRLSEAINIIHREYVKRIEDNELVKGCREGLEQQIGVAPGVLLKKENNPSATRQAFIEISDILSNQAGDTSGALINANVVDGCLTGMLDSLGSLYIDEEDLKYMTEDSVAIAGVGLEFEIQDGFPTVVRAINDGPADRAKIINGDVIKAIDGVSTEGVSSKQVIRLLRGVVGSEIAFDIKREDTQGVLKYKLKREFFRIVSVQHSQINPSIGYLKINEFNRTTLQALADALQKLSSEADGRLRGIILDLRDNPGGMLHVAVGISAAFLPAGKFVTEIRGRTKDNNFWLTTDPEAYVLPGSGPNPMSTLDPSFKTVPLVVLVNHGSISGAEIVATALQDIKRATIVGDRTFGQTSVSTVFPLRDQTALKLKTANFIRPNGGAIEGIGVIPDITVPQRTPRGAPLAFEQDFQLQAALQYLKKDLISEQRN